MARTAIVAGAVAQRPHAGGHAWVFLQYLLGLRDLGWEVVFLDRLEAAMSVDPQGNRTAPERSVNMSYLDAVMSSFGLGDSYAVLCDGDRRSLGMSLEALHRRIDGADLFLNVNGYIDGEILERARFRAFFDIDPGFGHMWQELGLYEMFRDHHAYVTVGQNIGRPDCAIPTCGLEWIGTPQPVVLDRWPAAEGGSAFTSVGAWRGPSAAIEYKGETYGLRVHEFRRFAAIPRRTREPFEVALDIHSAEVKDLAMLQANRWSLVDPIEAAGDPARYQSYLQGSKAEFMVAKGMYVKTRSGWFSDRSACYLASGRPVLAQDTGLDGLYPLGEGLIAFSNLDDAVAGAEEIAAEPERHSKAARRIAEEFFDSRKVLSRLLSRLGL